jgi:hypothetical protein
LSYNGCGELHDFHAGGECTLHLLHCRWRMRNFEIESRFVPFEPSRFFALRMTETIVTSNSVTNQNREMTDIRWSWSSIPPRSGPVTVTAALIDSRIQQQQNPPLPSISHRQKVRSWSAPIPCMYLNLRSKRKCQSRHGHFQMRLHAWLKHQEFKFRWLISS